MKWLAKLATKQSWLVISLFVILTVVIGAGLRNVNMDESTDALQPDESPVVALNEEIDATFGESPEIAIILLEGDIYTPEALTENPCTDHRFA